MDKAEWIIMHELDGGIILCCNAHSDAGFLPEVYLGPGGIFVCMYQCENPREAFISLRSLFETTRIELYLAEKGLYDPTHDVFLPLGDLLSEEPLIPPPMHFVMHRIGLDRFRRQFSPDDITRFCNRLVHSDALHRGQYLDAEGNLYLRYGTDFRAVSRKNSDTLYLTTLFGGVLGLHRFLLGKWCTGMLYLCTGGLFMTGYAMDLLFLHFGIMKDGKGLLLSPLCNRLIKILLLAPGAVFSVFLAHWQVNTFLHLTSAFQSILTQATNENHEVLTNLFSRIMSGFP